MSITEKMWDGITRVIKMDSKVENLAATMVDQQKRIEDLTGRIIRLETALEIALVSQSKNIGKIINRYQPSKRTIRKPSSST
jgi:retron-type reverse transcriptase